MKFTLINPILKGTIKTTFESENGKDIDDIAKKFWKLLTVENEAIVNELKEFYFSFIDENDGLYHFEVNEEIKDGEVSFNINNISEKMSSDEKAKFIENAKKNLEEKPQEGGKKKSGKKASKKKGSKRKNITGGKHRYKHSSSSSSSSSSDDDLKYKFKYNVPIASWWYAPTIYKVNRITTPVFTKVYSPYTQLWIPV